MVSAEDCPSMGDVKGGKVHRERESQSSEERAHVRKKAKATADAARSKWLEIADNSSILETGTFGDGIGPGGTTSPDADTNMLDAGDKTADPAAALPG